MYKRNQFYCVTPEWQEDLATILKAEFIENKIIRIPEALGTGQSFFIQVIPGIAALLMDFILNSPLKIKRIEDSIERYIFHFDLSDQANTIKIGNVNYKVGHTINLDLAVLNNQVESFFIPLPGERTFVLRIFVDKKLMNEFLKNDTNREEGIRKNKFSKNEVFHYTVDSNSILQILSLKEKSVFDDSFDPFLKGISLKLLGSFLSSYSQPVIQKDKITPDENEAIAKARNYLLQNLHNSFPSITDLSKIAGMSNSRFKVLFKKHFFDTPKSIFIRDKMVLAHTLLKSGDFSTLTDVIHELNYVKLDYFSSKYFDFFHRKPSEDFVKKNLES